MDILVVGRVITSIGEGRLRLKPGYNFGLGAGHKEQSRPATKE